MSNLEELINRVKNDGTTPDIDMETIYKIVEKMKKEDKTLQEVCKIEDTLLEEIYQIAYNYYNQGKYQDALNLFIFLHGVSSKSYKYSFGLASSCYQLENYPIALFFFLKASLLDPTCPLAPFYASDIMIKLEKIEDALVGLTHAMELMEGKESFSPLLERCRLIKEGLESRTKK